MKSSLLQLVKLEKTVELKTDVETTKERLRSIGEECRSRLADGSSLRFRYFNRGQMSVIAYTGSPLQERITNNKIYSATGEVEDAGDKTLVKIYSVKNKSLVFFRVVYAIIFLAFMGIFIADAIISGKGLSSRELITAIIGLLGAAVIFVSTHTETTNADSDIKLMVEEIERRAVAVDHWDDLKPLDFD